MQETKQSVITPTILNGTRKNTYNAYSYIVRQTEKYGLARTGSKTLARIIKTSEFNAKYILKELLNKKVIAKIAKGYYVSLYTISGNYNKWAIERADKSLYGNMPLWEADKTTAIEQIATAKPTIKTEATINEQIKTAQPTKPTTEATAIEQIATAKPTEPTEPSETQKKIKELARALKGEKRPSEAEKETAQPAQPTAEQIAKEQQRRIQEQFKYNCEQFLIKTTLKKMLKALKPMTEKEADHKKILYIKSKKLFLDTEKNIYIGYLQGTNLQEQKTKERIIKALSDITGLKPDSEEEHNQKAFGIHLAFNMEITRKKR